MCVVPVPATYAVYRLVPLSDMLPIDTEKLTVYGVPEDPLGQVYAARVHVEYAVILDLIDDRPVCYRLV